MSRGPRYYFWLLLRFAAAGVLIFFGIELLLRTLQPASLDYYRKLKLLHVYHPEYRVGLAPGASYYLKHNTGLWEGQFTINSLGYRGSAEPDGRPIVGCLGDSLVMGFGVSDDQTFCSLLDGLELGGSSHQTQNLGVDAFGSKGYAARFAEAVEKLPELKIVLLFVSPNDFTLPQELLDRGVLPDDVTDAAREKNPGREAFFRAQFELTRYSATLHAAAVARQQLIIRRALFQKSVRREFVEAGIIPHVPEIDGDVPYIGFGKYMERSFYKPSPESDCSNVMQDDVSESPAARCPERVPSHIICLDQEPTADEPLPEITAAAYDRMIDLARKHGVVLVPVFLPVQVETLHCSAHDKYTTFFNHARRAKEYFRERGITSLDLRAYTHELCGMEDASVAGEARSFGVMDHIIPGDGHLTVRGNRWAARALRIELQRMERRFTDAL